MQTKEDPADKLRLTLWECRCCARQVEIPLKLARMLRNGEIAYICGVTTTGKHRIELEGWR